MKKPLLLGCIADDFTGASDLANTLCREGMRATLYIDVPQGDIDTDGVSSTEVAIIALKSRSIDADDAVQQSLSALRWLQNQGAQQFLFKYCSTFDSTPAGNIGPVAEALAAELDTKGVVVCPAFPTTGRTVYQGHLFVGDTLLNESGLQNHPLNPMTDADLRRWLSLQVSSEVGHVPQTVVSESSEAIASSLKTAGRSGQTLVVVDATADVDLRTIGTACADAKLITGGSGIALGLPQNFRIRGLLSDEGQSFQPQQGPAIIIAGSCSEATRQQIAAYNGGPKIVVDIDALMADKLTPEHIVKSLPGDESVALLYSSGTPDEVKALQAEYGVEAVAGKIENFFSSIASRLLDNGYKRFVIAGGETSGAVVSALNIQAFDIGPEIDPGVPTLSTTLQSPTGKDTATNRTTESNAIAMALKSGNFGAEDFFSKALRQLQGQS